MSNSLWRYSLMLSKGVLDGNVIQGELSLVTSRRVENAKHGPTFGQTPGSEAGLGLLQERNEDPIRRIVLEHPYQAELDGISAQIIFLDPSVRSASTFLQRQLFGFGALFGPGRGGEAEADGVCKRGHGAKLYRRSECYQLLRACEDKVFLTESNISAER